MCSIWGIPVLWSGCWLCTPTKSSFTRSCSGDGSFLKRTLEPRNLAAFSISAFNYRVTMNRIDKGHAEKRGKNHQFVKIKEIMWKQYSCGSMHSHDLCFFQLENHTSKVKSRGKLREFSVQKIKWSHIPQIHGTWWETKEQRLLRRTVSGLSTSGQASNSYKFKTKYMR